MQDPAASAAQKAQTICRSNPAKPSSFTNAAQRHISSLRRVLLFCFHSSIIMMHLKLRLLPALAVAAILLSSCHRVPRHGRYVPKDAFMVLGVHTGEMRKELAWSAITGSGLLDELRKKGAAENAPAAIKDLDNSGIDFSSVLYFYTKPDTRFADGMRMAAVLPVADAGKVKDYFIGHFPGIQIRNEGGRDMAMLDGKMCVSWNDDVLIASNSIVHKEQHDEPGRVDTLGGVPIQGAPYSWTEEQPDSGATIAEMARSFQPEKSSGIDDNHHFRTLEKAGHDITLWVNYDAIMDLANSRGVDQSGLGIMGTSVGNTLFKGSTMATGFDFEKGRIDGLMRYYPSDSMKPVAHEFAKENIDGDMLRRLPAPGLNLAAGYHLSPAVVKLTLEKMGLSGVANLALMAQGATMDDVLGGFTGDMVVAINNFRVVKKMQGIDSATQNEYGLAPYPITTPSMDFVFAMKIGDKTKFNRLLTLLSRSAMIRQAAPNAYMIAGMNGATMVIGDKYVATSSNIASAQAFLKEHAGAMPDAVHQEISGHPFGLWVDIQSFLAGTAALAVNSPSDSAAFAITRNVFGTFSLHGGEMKDDANEYRMSLHFLNRDENSLVQLLHFAQQLSALRNKNQEVTFR